MQSILNVNVSCFRNYDSADNPRSVNLLDWLKSKKYRDRVDQIRKIQDKELRDTIKATLPAITPSGIFSYRSESSLVKHSGLIQVDIDRKENGHIDNYDGLISEFCKLPNVAFAGRSVSGNGYWLLIPIAFPQRHKEHFEFLKRFFASHAVNIDNKPKNVASLRGYSYDPDAYFNHGAIPLQKYYEEPVRAKTVPHHAGQDAETIRQIIEQVEKGGIDVTSDYGAWFAIGCDIASTFGNSGEEYFHMISRFHPQYTQRKTEIQFQACLKFMRSKAPGLGALVNAAKAYGIRLTYTDCSADTDLTRIVFQNGKRMEVLKSGDLMEVTPEGYPVLWDTIPEDIIQHNKNLLNNNSSY